MDGDAQQPDREILYVNQGGLGLPDRDYYLKDEAKLREYREKYVALLTTLLTLAKQPAPDGGGQGHLRPRNPAGACTLDQRREPRCGENLQQARARGPSEGASLASIGTRGPPSLASRRRQQSSSLNPLTSRRLPPTVNELPVDRWKPYLRTAMLNGFAPYLSKPFVDAEFGFYGQALRGVKENQPRWKRAVNTINGNLGEMLGKLYVERHFTPRAKARMEQLVENLRKAFREGIDGLEWMGPETKKQAQAKLAKFRPKVGYPSKWRDYSRVQIVKDDLVGNRHARVHRRKRISARQKSASPSIQKSGA